jgi:hypothetical protein
MFKKLLLVAVLVLGLAFTATAMDIGQTCTMIYGAKVLLMVPGRGMKGVVVPEDTQATVLDIVPKDMVNVLNEQTQMDWTGSAAMTFSIDFNDGRGPQPIYVIVRAEDVKDCR